MRALLKSKWMALPALALMGSGLAGCGGTVNDCLKAVDDLIAAGVSETAIASAEAYCAVKDPAVRIDPDCTAEDTTCLSPAEILEAATLNPHSNHPIELALAFKQIKNNKADDAKETMTPFLTAEDEPEVYTYVVASLKSGVDALAPLLDLIASQLAPGLAGGLLPAQTDFRTFVQSVLQPIIDNLEDIADQAPLIQASADTYLNIPSIPLELDPSVLDDSLPADLEMDLDGGFDRAELLAVGSLSNGLLGGIDFLFGHSLKLSLGDLSDLDSSSGIAAFLAKSTDLLILDKPANVDSAATRFIAALDFLVGTADGGVGGTGLLDAIEIEMGQDQTDDIIIFSDVDGDGQVSEEDQLELRFVSQLIGQVDEIEAGDEIVSVPFVRDVWVALIELGRALNANLRGGASFSLGKYLSAKLDGKPAGTKYLWEELQEEVADDLADTALEGDFDFPDDLPDLEDWIHLDPKAYFKDPIALRNLLPAITVIDVDGVNEYEFALECELGMTAEQFADPDSTGGLAEDSAIRAICSHKSTGDVVRIKRVFFADTVGEDATTTTEIVTEGGDESPDFMHFASFAVAAVDDGEVTRAVDLAVTAPAEMTAPVLIDLEFAEDLGTEDQIIDADGFKPTLRTASNDPHDDILLSGLLQNPDLGGTLLIDLDPSTGSGAAKATNSTLNAGISQIWITFGGHIEALIDGLTD